MEAIQENRKSNSQPNVLGKKSFFSPSRVQTKLTVNLPGDKYEVEADQVAEQVVQRISDASSGPSSSNQYSPDQKSGSNVPYQPFHQNGKSFSTFSTSSSIQTKCDACEAKEKEKPREKEVQRKPEAKYFLQAKCDGCREESTLMAKRGTTQQPTVSPETTSQLFASKGGGDPLPKNTRSEMESGFGVDFSNVRTHTSPSAIKMSKNLGAQAFTHGPDIYFNSGKFDTQSQGGKKLLAHELTHVVQQQTPGKLIQADFAVEPTTPNRRVPTLTPDQIQSAIDFNQARHTDATEISLLRDIIGLSREPSIIDVDFINSLLEYQAQYGLRMDGKLGHGTAARLAREIVAEGDFLGPGNRGSLDSAFSLVSTVRTLISANNRSYQDYKIAIQGGTMIRQQVALLDEQLLRDIRGQLTWSNWARCIELLGRLIPTFNDLSTNPTVRATLAQAWTDSNPSAPGPGTTQHEEGGWIYLNLVTGVITTRRAPVGRGASINLDAPPDVAESVVIGMFHTHPNLGPGWTPGPSPTDLRLDARDGVPDIVVGSPTADPARTEFFQSGPDRREHLGGNRGLPGAAGGIAPQAKADGTLDER